MGTAPNLLVIMSDEHAPQFSGFGGHPLVRTPHLDRLAARGVLFENAYCASPLCVPSRMAFMTGRYPHHNGAYDNATALSSDAVTWAHLLRAAGYDAVLCGKQHFVGPDQLHGFRAQIGFDLHAQQRPRRLRLGAGHGGRRPVPGPGVAQAGPGSTREIEVDDAVEAAALDYLRDGGAPGAPLGPQRGLHRPPLPPGGAPARTGTCTRRRRSTCPRSRRATWSASTPSSSACGPCSGPWRRSPRRSCAGPGRPTTG